MRRHTFVDSCRNNTSLFLPHAASEPPNYTHSDSETGVSEAERERETALKADIEPQRQGGGREGLSRKGNTQLAMEREGRELKRWRHDGGAAYYSQYGEM